MVGDIAKDRKGARAYLRWAGGSSASVHVAGYAKALDRRRDTFGLRDVAGGVVGPGSAVVIDDLDVVPVGVEHERAVVARVVDRALARRAVVLVARR